MMSITKIFSDFFASISEIVTKLPSNLAEVAKSPLTILALLGFIIIFFVLIKVKNIKFDAKMISTIGVMLALTTILDLLKIYHFPQGGGVTLGAMIPLFLIAYMYGPIVGMFTGFLFGLISLIFDPFILQPVQVLFDYPLPYLALGIAGFFPNKKLIGAALAILTRYTFHFISGVIFFGSYAPEGMSPWIYSLSVNGTLGLAEGVLTLVILAILPVNMLIKSQKQSFAS